MKRSEMLEILEEVLIHNIEQLHGELINDDVLEFILTKIEEAGMIAPLSDASESELNELIWTSEHVNGKLHDAHNILSYITWEEES